DLVESIGMVFIAHLCLLNSSICMIAVPDTAVRLHIGVGRRRHPRLHPGLPGPMLPRTLLDPFVHHAHLRKGGGGTVSCHRPMIPWYGGAFLPLCTSPHTETYLSPVESPRVRCCGPPPGCNRGAGSRFAPVSPHAPTRRAPRLLA